MAHRQNYEHLTGWAADLLVSLDIIDLGLLGFVARSSPARRQATFCVLAHVGEPALARIQHYGQPVLCEEVIALKAVARDLRKLGIAALLSRYVPTTGKSARLALARTQGIQTPAFYCGLVRRYRLDVAVSTGCVGPRATNPTLALERVII